MTHTHGDFHDAVVDFAGAWSTVSLQLVLMSDIIFKAEQARRQHKLSSKCLLQSDFALLYPSLKLHCAEAVRIILT